jgi:hypothetical protein
MVLGRNEMAEISHQASNDILSWVEIRNEMAKTPE